MAVASPYAVFRAVDLGWPTAMPVIETMPVIKPEPVRPNQGNRPNVPPAGRITPTKRRYGGGLRRRTAPQWSTLIQGELFPA
ncbi:hypothetical protein [Vulcanococcus sp.]|jgi:hypothetical protein|uniref:hypothetical protein n=1 Tax=Vulcanococcus sp. TaxID=2856995 RepID=UPI0037DA0653